MSSRCILYAREQAGRPIDDQIAMMRRWVEENQHTVRIEHSDTVDDGLEDIGLPGPGLFDSLIGVRKGDIFLVYNSSIVFPSPEMVAMITRMVRSRGGRCVTLQGEWEPVDERGSIIYKVISAYDMYAREFRKELNRSRMRTHQAAGRPVNNKPPYGWKMTFKNQQWVTEPDDAEQKVLKLIIDSFVNGMAITAIQRMLKEKNCKARCGRHFQYNTLRRIIGRYKRSLNPDLDKFEAQEKRIQ